MAEELQSGSVWVNCYESVVPYTPFGGYKQSGYGRDLGQYAIQHYTRVKVVNIDLEPSGSGSSYL
eukprot:NODE_2926_length_445_cov_244.558081_g2320_i0.p2 GENE.NODE_2926_length_445_cov_244.558081_g2320_i0~~NODE_2926_length_445_cov_244.558081_g2320_i0.p2  ORF type:complete len:65 (-),score=13.12 NODE_2926_length_445_cov_244.558081_g2320_i0:122-316(-)